MGTANSDLFRRNSRGNGGGELGSTWGTPMVDATHSGSAHHSQFHQSDHNNAAADDLKLDDLAAPDDNTNLDFSSSAHGLVPKGTNAGYFLKLGHTHRLIHRSTVVSGNRAAAAGSGDQAVTGAGFTPITVIALCADNANQAVASWGFGDGAVAEHFMLGSAPSLVFNTQGSTLMWLDDGGADTMKAVLKTLDSDGCTLTWTKGGSGLQANFVLLFLR